MGDGAPSIAGHLSGYAFVQMQNVRTGAGSLVGLKSNIGTVVVPTTLGMCGKQQAKLLLAAASRQNDFGNHKRNKRHMNHQARRVVVGRSIHFDNLGLRNPETLVLIQQCRVFR